MRIRKLRRTTIGGIAFAALLLCVMLLFVLKTRRGPVGNAQRLADGSTFELKEIGLMTTNYSYTHVSGGKLLQMLSPILPQKVLNYFRVSSGGFGFGGSGVGTNLVVITVHHQINRIWSSGVGRLRVSDGGTNIYDARWGAHTLGLPSETVNGWQIEAMPRRSSSLKLEFLATGRDGNWISAATFDIPNPFYANYREWTAEPWPVTKSDGDLTVTLGKFESGGQMAGRHGLGDPANMARKTSLRFDFEQDGKSSKEWAVQKVTISDATGNRWSPYLDLVEQEFNWARGGKVEFFGALWPGEQAWKLNVELVRTRGFTPDELYDVALPLPAARTVTALTNQWEKHGVVLKLAGFGSPETDHPGDFRWVAKWWGAGKDKIYSLALQLNGERKGRRLSFVRAVDQDGTEVKLVQHQNREDDKQALFLKPAADAQTVRLTLGLQRSRFVEFLARPEFVEREEE